MYALRYASSWYAHATSHLEMAPATHQPITYPTEALAVEELYARWNSFKRSCPEVRRISLSGAVNGIRMEWPDGNWSETTIEVLP